MATTVRDGSCALLYPERDSARIRLMLIISMTKMETEVIL